VEDNSFNQQVAVEILNAVGLTVEIANNGREAVQAVASSKYDLVLMDLQMPVMSGYEATKLIRANGDICLPIIAMTAHAMQGVKDDCLAVGMDGFVSKPIDQEELFTVLGRWLKSREKKLDDWEKAEERQVKISGEADFPEELSGIDIDSGLRRLNGNKKLFRELLIGFSKEYAVVTQKIKNALEGSDMETAQRLVHTLKGLAGNLAAYGVHDAAGKLEVALDEGAGSEDLLEELGVALEFLPHLPGRLESNKEMPVKERPVDMMEVGRIMGELLWLIKEGNIDAVIRLENLKQCIDTEVFAEEFGELEENLKVYDFENALQSLVRIAGAMNIVLIGGTVNG